MGTATYTGDCPSCGTRNSGFTSVGQSSFYRQGRLFFNLFMHCNSCGGGIVMVVYDSQSNQGPLSGGGNRYINSADVGIVVQQIHPSFPIAAAPADTPQGIANTFCEAEDNCNSGKYDTCGMLLRKTMDVATKLLRGDAAKREQLYERIEALTRDGLITADMAKWAHAVRLDGRGAVHDDEALTEPQARDLLSFTRTFLLYAFTLPAMVERRTPPVTEAS